MKETFEVGILRNHENFHLACSPEAIALILVCGKYDGSFEGCGDLSHNNESIWFPPLELMTKVAVRTLGTTIEFTRGDPLLCDVGDETCKKFIPPEHLYQNNWYTRNVRFIL